MHNNTSAHPHIYSSAHQHIFLIGFMGSGKTYWGKKWAEKSGIRFYDVDELVEEKQSKTISQIFEMDGEGFFRHMETQMLQKLPQQENFIVSTGGGLPCFNNNMQWMNEHGTTFYLQSSVKNILERLMNETHTRPLIKDLSEKELEEYVHKKLKEREQFYKHAKIILHVDDLDENYLPEIFLSQE